MVSYEPLPQPYTAHGKSFVLIAFGGIAPGTIHAIGRMVIRTAQSWVSSCTESQRPPRADGGILNCARCPQHLLLALAAFVFLLGGCHAPISAIKTSPGLVYRQVHENAIRDGKPSDGTQSVLFRYGVAEQFEKDPDAILSMLHDRAVELEDRQLVFAMSELSYLAGGAVQRSMKPWEPRDARDYYLSAAVYAWFYLFGSPAETAPTPYDRQFRLACDLYNRALAAALIPRGNTNAVVEMASGPRRLVVGNMNVTFKPDRFPLPPYELSQFLAADQFVVEGFSVRNRQPGLGAPLIAVAPPLKKIPFSRSLPATVLLRVSGTLRGLKESGCTGSLELYSAYDDQTFTVNSQAIPLETDITAHLAYSLNQGSLWKLGERQFLSGVEQVPTGVYETRPYEPGKIPVLLVHGTFSSPVWWVEMLNTLNADPVLRKRFQFWWFVYNSGSPSFYSALKLRESLTNKLQQLDPNGTDRALQQMVIIGHSQGGLLTKLTATDTENKLRDAIAPQTEKSLRLSAEQEQLVHEYTVFTPLPFVKRVVFICTPHRGSYQAGNLVRNLARRMVTLPDKLLDSQERLLDIAARLDPNNKFDRRLRTSLDSMSPSNPVLQALANIPLASGIKGHSIIAVKGDGDYTQGKDGMVQYSSAHLDGMESEYIVRGPHSCLSHPATIEEVRRILRLHVAEAPLVSTNSVSAP